MPVIDKLGTVYAYLNIPYFTSESKLKQEISNFLVTIINLNAFIFLIAGIAETHRLPFDLPEAESELIAGFHSEYSGMKFGMYFEGKYLRITLVSCLITILFFGGWLGPALLPPIVWFLIKMFCFILFFVLLRAGLPRPRYDQLMSYGWKLLLPLALLNVLVTGAVVLLTQ